MSPHPATRGPHRPRVGLSTGIIAILVLGGVAATTNAQTFALLLSPLAADLGYSVETIGGFRTIEEIVAVLTGIALTPFIDRYPRRLFLMIGLVLMGGAALLAGLAAGIAMLVGYFVIDGIAKILLFSSLLSMPSDLASGRAHDRALGFVIGSFSLAGFTVIPLAGLLAERFSWRAGYFLASGVSIMTLMIVAALLPSIRPAAHAHGSIRAQAKALARLPGLPAGIAGALFRFTIFASVLTYSGAYLIDEHRVSVSRAGLFFSLGAAAFLVASITSGFILARLGLSRALLPGGMLCALLVLAAFGSNASLLLAGPALLSAVALMGLLENASTGLLLRLAPDDRGAAMTLNELAASAGSFVGIGVAALALRVSGYAGVGLFLFLIGALGVITTRVALRALRPAPVPEVALAD